MEVRIAVTLLQIIEGNLAAIETLEKMHHEDAKERGVIARHLERNPWLIDTSWMLNKAEGRVATWIEKEFGLKREKQAGDDDRVDFSASRSAGHCTSSKSSEGLTLVSKPTFSKPTSIVFTLQSDFRNLRNPTRSSIPTCKLTLLHRNCIRMPAA